MYIVCMYVLKNYVCSEKMLIKMFNEYVNLKKSVIFFCVNFFCSSQWIFNLATIDNAISSSLFLKYVFKLFNVFQTSSNFGSHVSAAFLDFQTANIVSDIRPRANHG